MNFDKEELVPYGYTAHNFNFDGCDCVVVEPENPLPGRRWVWKAAFFKAFPKFEMEMLHRGYYLCFMEVGNTFGCPDAMKHFDKFYDMLTSEHGFACRPILLGLSRGGLYIYNWAYVNPDKVGCIYADNPVCDFKSWPGAQGRYPASQNNWQQLLEAYHFASDEEALAYPNPVDRVEILVKAGIPMIHVAATDDEVVAIEENTDIMEKKIRECGGTLKVFRHPGGHHPHGLDDPRPVADWIESNARR